MSLVLPSVPAEPQPGSDGSLLVVDDDEAVLRSTAKLLSAHGLAIVTASSVDEALTILRSETTVSAVLCDMVMPGLTGTDLDRRVRSLRPNLPVVFMTGFANEQVEVSDDRIVLSKPLDVGALLETLGSVLDESLA